MSAYVPMHKSNNYSNAIEVTLHDMGAIRLIPKHRKHDKTY